MQHKSPMFPFRFLVYSIITLQPDDRTCALLKTRIRANAEIVVTVSLVTADPRRFTNLSDSDRVNKGCVQPSISESYELVPKKTQKPRSSD